MENQQEQMLDANHNRWFTIKNYSGLESFKFQTGAILNAFKLKHQ